MTTRARVGDHPRLRPKPARHLHFASRAPEWLRAIQGKAGFHSNETHPLHGLAVANPDADEADLVTATHRSCYSLLQFQERRWETPSGAALTPPKGYENFNGSLSDILNRLVERRVRFEAGAAIDFQEAVRDAAGERLHQRLTKFSSRGRRPPHMPMACRNSSAALVQRFTASAVKRPWPSAPTAGSRRISAGAPPQRAVACRDTCRERSPRKRKDQHPLPERLRAGERARLGLPPSQRPPRTRSRRCPTSAKGGAGGAAP